MNRSVSSIFCRLFLRAKVYKLQQKRKGAIVMKKKLLSVLLAAAMVSSVLVGCSGKEASSAPDQSAGSTTQSTPATKDKNAYPNKDITVLIPKGAGGGTDTSARAFMQFVSEKLPSGVNMVGVNNPEGNGVISMEQLSSADGDGYTIGMVVVEAAMMPWQGQMTSTVSDYKAIAATIADPIALVVSADAPYDNLSEFVEYCEANPNTLTVGNAGTVSSTYIAAKQMADDLDLEIVHVPYETGTGDAIAALVGGHIDAVMSTPGNAKAQVEAGTLKYLGLMADNRMSLFPDIPTFKEEVGMEFELLSWACMCAPASINDEAYNYLCDTFRAVAESAEFKTYMENLGIEPVVVIGQDAQDMIERDSEMYRALIEG